MGSFRRLRERGGECNHGDTEGTEEEQGRTAVLAGGFVLQNGESAVGSFCAGGWDGTVWHRLASFGTVWRAAVGSFCAGARDVGNGSALPSPRPSPRRVEVCARRGPCWRGRAKEGGGWFTIGVSL